MSGTKQALNAEILELRSITLYWTFGAQVSQVACSLI